MYQMIAEDLLKVFQDGAYLNMIVSARLKSGCTTEHEGKLYTRFMYGVVEKKLLIDAALKPILQGKRVKPYLKNILRMGAYGIDFMDIANHYLVNELVGVVKRKDYKGSQFVNAILRSYLQSGGTAHWQTQHKGMDDLPYYATLYSVPVPLLSLLQLQYPKEWQHFFPLNQKVYYNTYRIQLLRASKNEVITYLAEQEIPYLWQNEMLYTKTSLVGTPLFQEGKIIAQDVSSAMVARIVRPTSGMRILDACSAPGGKALHLADIMENNGEIIACDIYQHKLDLIEQNAKKLGVTIIHPLLMDSRTYQDEMGFDIVLADVPCSGLGVMQRKPDLKYHMTLEKILEIMKLQWQILTHVATLVKVGGTLVYSTCTINKQENEQMIYNFICQYPAFQIIEEHVILPSINEQDGFYICKLRKEKSHAEHL